MDVSTDQQAISQDYWPTEESFQRKEILKWWDISYAVYKIEKVAHRRGKFGNSAILTLETTEMTFVCGSLNALQKTCWKTILLNLSTK